MQVFETVKEVQDYLGKQARTNILEWPVKLRTLNT